MYVSREEVPAEVLEREREIYRGQMEGSGKPAQVIDKIVEGKLGSFYEQVCLLDQPSIRDPKRDRRGRCCRRRSPSSARTSASRGSSGSRSAKATSRLRLDAGTRYNSVSVSSPVYSRVLLKLSGEALMGEQAFGIDPAIATHVAAEIGEIQQLGVQTAVVIGGGNIFRGLAASARGMDRVDRRLHGHAGHGHQRAGAAGCARADRRDDPRASAPSRCAPSPSRSSGAAPSATSRRAGWSIFAAGTGNPYFTTDTAAALRAMEMRAEVILKGTKVDGIYTADPMIDACRGTVPRASRTCRCSSSACR